MKNKILSSLLLAVLIIICLLIEYSVDMDEVSIEQYQQTIENPIVIENYEEDEGDSIEPLKVYFFYVGQAESIFVQNGNSCMLIDAGNNEDGEKLSEYIKNDLGIKKIDYLIGTHAHEDHIGGTDVIIKDFEIGRFFMPNRSTTFRTYKDVVSEAKKKNIDIESPKVGTKFKIGEAECEIMTQNDDAEEINDTSIVIQLSFGKHKFLFTGDIEESVERSREWEDIDILKVAHHGTTYASKNNFLKQVKPEIAVIMCGKENDYHYPHDAVRSRLAKNDCKEIYITSEKGTIIMQSDGSKITTECRSDLDFDGNK